MRSNIQIKLKRLTTLTPNKILAIFFLYILIDWTLTYFDIFQSEFRDFLSRYAIVIPLHITFYYYGRAEQSMLNNSKRIDKLFERTTISKTNLEVLMKEFKGVKKENAELHKKIQALLIILAKDVGEEDGKNIDF